MKRNALKEIVAQVLEIEPSALTTEVDLRSFPLFDSVNVLMLVVALDEEAGIKLSVEDMASLETFGQIEAAAAKSGVSLED